MQLTHLELQKLKSEIFKDIKTQSDRKSQVVANSSLVINPQALISSNPTIYGPFYFGTKFIKNPFISFGQARLNTAKVSNTIAQTTVDPSQHLVVQPYISSWVSDSGGVTGFYLGVLALTAIPTALTKHTITYHATGRATSYKSDDNSRWKQQSSPAVAPHLTQEAGYLENLT